MASQRDATDPVKEPKMYLAQLEKPKSSPQPVRLLQNGMLDINNVEGELLDISLRNSKTPLLRLPGELRNIIWGLLLKKSSFIISYSKCTTEVIYGNPTPHQYGRIAFPPKNYLALSQVCRQLYADTALLPFKLNPLRIISKHDFEWVAELTKAQRGAIVEVHLHTMNAVYPTGIMNTMDVMDATNLCFHSGGAGLPEVFPVELFPGLQRVLVRVMIRGRTKTDMILKVQELGEYIKNGRDHIRVDFIW